MSSLPSAPAAHAATIPRRFPGSLQQGLAWFYCALFVFVLLVTNLPGLADAEGRNLGLFKIDPIDNVIHGLSGVWAAYGAWRSPGASRFYFRAFGLFYTLDAFIGLFTGYATIDLLTHFSPAPGYSMLDNIVVSIAANLPHFVIGPVALMVGFLLPDTVRAAPSPQR